MPIARLLLNDLCQRKTRCALTIGAVAISVSLVVAMTGGFASLKATAYRVLGTFYGDVDVTLEPREGNARWFDAAMVETLRADPRVASVKAQLTAMATFSSDRRGGRPAQVIGIDPHEHAKEQLRPLKAGRWFTADQPDAAVVDENVARMLGIPEPIVGAAVRLRLPDRRIELTIVGVTARPGVFQIDLPSVYIPLPRAQEVFERPGEVNVLEVDLKTGQDVKAFADEVEAHPPPGQPPVLVKTVARQQARFDRNFEALELLSYLGGSVSMIAAVFIIFSTLSMGVSERSRLLAMLRAIGAERSQVARLVLAEGLLLSLCGSLGGVALGYLWVTLLVGRVELFTAGVVMSVGGILYGVVGSVAAALLASALPAYAASRVSPLEAMTLVARQRSARGPWIWALAGLALLALDPAIIYAPGIERETRIPLHLYFGPPTFMLGLFAISPAVVLVIDRLLGPVTARLLLLQPALLRQQLSGGLWRSAGTASALMVGLAVLVLIRVHGANMIGTWKLPDRFPDVLIFSLIGATEEQVAELDKIDGLAAGQVLPVAVASPKVGANIFGLGGLMQAPDATILFGLDAVRAFGSDNPEGRPMIELEFLEGDRETAARKMREGRHIVVSEEFRTLKGLSVGDTLELETTVSGRVDYTIVGVVRSPGIDMIVRMFQMEKEFNQWTSAAVATDIENVKRDFGVSRFNLMAGNLTVGDKDALERNVRNALRQRGMLAAGASSIKRVVNFGLARVLDLSSSVAVMAILVASIGVTNTIMASVRSRRWQLGVLRAVGLTRGAMLRLIVAEAVLIALAACVLGLGGGLLLSYSSDGMAGHVVGVRPRFEVRYPPLLLGGLVTLGVSMAAGFAPALRTAYAAPLRLLQGGRAAG